MAREADYRIACSKGDAQMKMCREKAKGITFNNLPNCDTCPFRKYVTREKDTQQPRRIRGYHNP